MNAETWKPAVGYEGRYDVSDTGRVRSHYHRWGRRDIPRVLKPRAMGKYPYCGVLLKDKDGECKNRYVHLLVLAAFIGHKPIGTEGSHLNGNSMDNSLGNLAWETHAENVARADYSKNGIRQ